MRHLPAGVREVLQERSDHVDRAIYSDDMRYRYLFERRWGVGDAAVWVLLNPATGDTDGKPRPTLAKCIARSRGWGCGAIQIVNLFSYRATKPRDLLVSQDPVGPHGDDYLDASTAVAPVVVAAWGAHGSLLGRGRSVAARLPRGTLCLGLTQKLQPRHPLYVRGDAEALVLDPWKDDELRLRVVE
jgi:hypothetical protein